MGKIPDRTQHVHLESDTDVLRIHTTDGRIYAARWAGPLNRNELDMYSDTSDVTFYLAHIPTHRGIPIPGHIDSTPDLEAFKAGIDAALDHNPEHP